MRAARLRRREWRTLAGSGGHGTALVLDNLPALSASLLVMSDEDGIFRDGFD